MSLPRCKAEQTARRGVAGLENEEIVVDVEGRVSALEPVIDQPISSQSRQHIVGHGSVDHYPDAARVLG